VQFTGNAYTDELKENDIKISMEKVRAGTAREAALGPLDGKTPAELYFGTAAALKAA